MFNPASKRRRLDAASTLSKPFKSPFKKALNPNHGNELMPLKRELPATNDQSHAQAAEVIAPHRSSNSTSKFSPVKTSLRSDPDILALERQHSTLLSTLNALRTDLDTHAQALKIETSGKDVELERLIGVWKTASRLAAEELFGGVKDRVNRMGGVGAWRERERNKNKGFGGGWEEVEKRDGSREDEEENEEDRGMLREEMEGRVDVDVREEAAAEVVEEGDDDDGFTMDMMLRSLNIELDAIGFDKEMQKWIN